MCLHAAQVMAFSGRTLSGIEESHIAPKIHTHSLFYAQHIVVCICIQTGQSSYTTTEVNEFIKRHTNIERPLFRGHFNNLGAAKPRPSRAALLQTVNGMRVLTNEDLQMLIDRVTHELRRRAELTKQSSTNDGAIPGTDDVYSSSSLSPVEEDSSYSQQGSSSNGEQGKNKTLPRGNRVSVAERPTSFQQHSATMRREARLGAHHSRTPDQRGSINIPGSEPEPEPELQTEPRRSSRIRSTGTVKKLVAYWNKLNQR